MRTSYSAIETYLTCPQKFKFQEIDRIRAPKSKEALFGSLIHASLKFMFERDPLFPTLDEVIDYFRAHWPAREVLNKEAQHDPLKYAWTETEEKIYFEQGVRMLKRFYEKNAPWNFMVIDLESRFDISLTDEKTGETHVLAGIIDRIDKLPDDTIEIIDYKTAKRMPSQTGVEQNLQLSLYALGVQKRWPHLTNEALTLSLYYVKHGEKLSAKPTDQSIGATKEKVLTTIAHINERIANEKLFEPMPGPLCNWCNYRPMCPAWKHLYKTRSGTPEQISQSEEEIKKAVSDYFDIKKEQDDADERLKEIQAKIKSYMQQERVTRVFGDEGMISQKTIQRYAYDLEKIKGILAPLGRWEELLKADEAKLKRLIKDLPPEARSDIESARSVAREYTVLAASAKKITPDASA